MKKDGTGKVLAEKVKEVLDDLGLAGNIIVHFIQLGLNWSHKVCCTILQNILKRQILRLACLHYVI